MPSGPTLAAFAAASVLLILLPGPAMLFLLARGIAGGRRVGVYSALGVESASAVYVVATALGLTAILAASGTALAVVRYVGAGYLIWLGLRTILMRNEPLVAASPGLATEVASGAWRSWRQGFAVGITNPKVALFFLAFFPQFVHPEAGPVAAQVFVLGALFVLIGAVLDVGYGLSGGLLGALLGRHPRALPRARVGVGLTFVTLGGVTAATGQRA
ncbi:MAG: LysE family translocator [Geodermatophilaceae bacterium]